jgi:hypothetical protein
MQKAPGDPTKKTQVDEEQYQASEDVFINTNNPLFDQYGLKPNPDESCP